MPRVERRARSPASATSAFAPQPRQTASGIPWMFPLGDVSGVFMSACASTQSSPTGRPALAVVERLRRDRARSRSSGRRRATTGIAPAVERRRAPSRAARRSTSTHLAAGTSTCASPTGQHLGLLHEDGAQLLHVAAEPRQPRREARDADRATGPCPRRGARRRGPCGPRRGRRSWRGRAGWIHGGSTRRAIGPRGQAGAGAGRVRAEVATAGPRLDKARRPRESARDRGPRARVRLPSGPRAPHRPRGRRPRTRAASRR